jgi:competence protein ComEC
MKPLDFISVKLCLALIAGICLGWKFPLKPGIAYLILGLSLVLLMLLFLFENYRRGILFGFGVLLTTLCLGQLLGTLAQPRHWPDHYTRLSKNHDGLWEVQFKAVLRSTAFNDHYLAEVRSCNTKPCRGVLLLTVRKQQNRPVYKVDELILVRGNLIPITPAANPHQFDYRSYMASMGVYHQMKIDKGSLLFRAPGKSTLTGRAFSVQSYLGESLQSSVLGSKELGILQAIVLGQRNELDPEVYQNYKDAGASHILAVSGLHIGILLLILQALLKPLNAFRFGKEISMLLCLLFLWAYAYITGLSPSVVRAVTTFSFIAYAMYLNRPTANINILALSMFCILLVQPLFLFQPGFQLSYAAILAIGWIYPILLRQWQPKYRLAKRLWRLLALSIAAQAGVFPLCLYYFHQFPALFFLSGLIIVPFLGILLGYGILVVLLASLNALPDLLAMGYDQLLKIMNAAVELIAKQEQFIYKGLSVDITTLVLLYLLVILTVLQLRKRRFGTIVYIGIIVMVIQGWTFFRIYNHHKTEEVIIVHQMGNTGILFQKNGQLQVLTPDPERLQTLIDDLVLNRFLSGVSTRRLPPSFSLGNQHWVVVDKSGILPPFSAECAPSLLLSQSPPIHLERILKMSYPSIVIADGSNYTGDIARWKATCEMLGIPFYSTAEQGALTIRLM